MAKIVLNAKNITKYYRTRTAVDDVSFQVLEGEIFGLLGPNGAGKSTIIKIITGLAKMDKGDVIICDYSIKSDFEKAIKNIGGIIEYPICYNYMTGIQNLQYYASLYKNISMEQISKCVELVGLENRIHEKVKFYSLGMKQRLGIAQALLHNPKILILDEPTNGLDPNGILEMRKFLKYLSRKMGIAIIISSHILSEMELICDTIAIISNGELKEIKTIEQLKKGKEDTERIAIKVNYPNYAGKLLMDRYKIKVEIAGSNVIIEMPEDKIPYLTSFLIDKRLAIYGITKVTKSLEEIFLDIVNDKTNERQSIL